MVKNHQSLGERSTERKNRGLQVKNFNIKDSRDARLDIVGAMDFDFRDQGISPRRLPNWTRAQCPELMNVMLRMPSGVRIVFDTDATEIHLTAMTTTMVVGHTPAQSAATADNMKPVVCNLEFARALLGSESDRGNVILLDSKDRAKYEFKAGSESCFKFTGLPAGEKTCEMWLPQNAYIELRQLAVNDGATITRAAPDKRPKWIHYGSSISHCLEAKQPGLIWPAVAARSSGASLQNLGLAGECHLDPFIARVIRDSDSDLISLKVGINIVNRDSMRERVFVPALHGFLDTIRERHLATPIVLISPIFCPSVEDNPGPTFPGPDGKFRAVPGHQEIRGDCLTLKRMRSLMDAVVEKRGDANLTYIDGRKLFDKMDAVDLPDDLHPNARGYIRMGERFADAYLKKAVARII
jgi:hypothetical protein